MKTLALCLIVIVVALVLLRLAGINTDIPEVDRSVSQLIASIGWL